MKMFKMITDASPRLSLDPLVGRTHYCLIASTEISKVIWSAKP